MRNLIKNKIYKIDCHISSVIYVMTFYIEPEYRGNGYSRRIFNNIKEKYDKPIVLECFPTLLEFYNKLGFKEIGITVNGYIEMELN